MELLYALLLATAGVPSTFLLFLFLGAVYYDLTRSRIPPEFDHPLKLRVLYWVLIMAFIVNAYDKLLEDSSNFHQVSLTSILGKILEQNIKQKGKICESLRICRQIDILRLVVNLKKAQLDASLYAKDLLFDGVPVRVYQPKAPSAGRRKGMLLFHGGGGQLGNIDVYQDISNKIAKHAEVVLVCVGYDLSPEHSYPSQYKQCLAATVHFLKNAEVYGVDPSQVVIFGDSAGGNFASVVAQKLTERPDLPKLRAQVLIYAAVQAIDFNLPSYLQNAAMPLLTQENTILFGLQYFIKDPSLKDEVLKGSHVPDDFRLKYGKWVSADNVPEKFKHRGYQWVPFAPYKPEVYKQVPELLQVTFSSLFAEDRVIEQLPETFIVSCEYDVLRDDSLLYKKRLEDCGVKIGWFHSEQGFHGVINLADLGPFTFPAGVEILDRVVDFVKGL